jgi:hypothetical protein
VYFRSVNTPWKIAGAVLAVGAIGGGIALASNSDTPALVPADSAVVVVTDAPTTTAADTVAATTSTVADTVPAATTTTDGVIVAPVAAKPPAQPAPPVQVTVATAPDPAPGSTAPPLPPPWIGDPCSPVGAIIVPVSGFVLICVAGPPDVWQLRP